MSGVGERALGVAAGLLLDRMLGEPPTAWHPVAWFGTGMGALERRVYADSRGAGIGYALAGLGLGAISGAGLSAVLKGGRTPVVIGTAGPVGVAVGVASAGRMLRESGTGIGALLEAGDLEGARERLPWLVGRDPSGLDESGVAAAVVESLAENTVDAVIAPAFWGVVAGAPGALVHRAVNTMDAMVGHRSPRYTHFGWAAARTDDVLAWVPARLFAGLVAILSSSAVREPAPGCTPTRASATATGPRHVLRTVCRDAPAHPSPNAGVAESAVAAALGVQVGGPLRYGTRVEKRPTLGDGPRPTAADIDHARRLVDRAELLVVTCCVAVWAADHLMATTRLRAMAGNRVVRKRMRKDR